MNKWASTLLTNSATKNIKFHPHHLFQCLSSWPSRRLNCFMSCSLREPRQPGNARALRNQGQWTAFVAKGQCWFLSHACMHGERHVSHVACLQGLVESVCGGATVNRDPQKSKGIGLKSQLSLEYESQLFNHQTRGVFNASLSASSWNLAKKHPWNLDFATAVPPTGRSEIHLSYERKGSDPMKSSLVRRDSHFKIFQGNVIIPKYNPEIRIHGTSFPFFSSIPFCTAQAASKAKMSDRFPPRWSAKTNYSWRRVTTQQRTMKCQRSPEDPQSNGCLLVRVQSDSQHTTLETLTVNLDKFRQDSLICPLLVAYHHFKPVEIDV